MSKINILSSDIYNKISAGEVVERPASIVKELVENSIDAGAENIEITVKNGGIDLINVVDDGCGIEKDDIDVAFLPHTTSKIALAEDLSEIKTLGFRGEALASIAAVSVVEMLTKTEGDETGSKVEVQAGRIKSKGEFSANTGTSVWVRDLFYNVPARRKFLKSAGRESAEITSVVGKLILANPEIYKQRQADLSDQRQRCKRSHLCRLRRRSGKALRQIRRFLQKPESLGICQRFELFQT